MADAVLNADILPRWNLSNIYSSVEGDDYRTAFAKLVADVSAVERLFEEQGIRRLAAPPARANERFAKAAAEIIEKLNAQALLYETLESFIHGLVTTNSYDAAAARELSKLELVDVRRQQLDVRFRGWIGSLAGLLEELIPQHPVLNAHAFLPAAHSPTEPLLDDRGSGGPGVRIVRRRRRRLRQAARERHQPAQSPLRAERPERRSADHRRAQSLLRP